MYKTDMASASLILSQVWETDKQESTVKCGKCCDGGGQGPGRPEQGTHLIYWVRGGFPEKMVPGGKRWGKPTTFEKPCLF